MDIYVVAATTRNATNVFTVPNAAQYKGVRCREQEIVKPHYHILVRSRHDEELLYEDVNIISAMCGCLYCGDSKMTLSEFIRLYAKTGATVLEDVSGYFSIIIIQKNPVKIVLITDPLGLIPCFYYEGDDRVVFSTKLDFVRHNSMSTETAVDLFAVLEQVYFNYTLGDKTYFKNVFMQNAGSILEFDLADGAVVKNEKSYWHLSDVIGKLDYSLHDALEEYNHELVRLVNVAVESATRPTLALTAGYDSRTNLSVLRHRLCTIPCFSYGLCDSSDVKIPLSMKHILGVNYTPLYLDGHFENRFDGYAENAIFHSDGLGDLEKANNEYAYETLGQQYSDVIVGLFGSELLKAHSFPNRLVPDLIFDCFQRLNISLGHSFDNVFNPGLLLDFTRYLSGYLEDNYMATYEHLTDKQKRYLFYYYEGVRKYNMKELRIGRYYANVFTPYVARQLLEIVFGSKISSVNFERNMISRYAKKLRSHFVYSSVMHRNMPQLNDIITNKGYKPKYDLSLFTGLLVIPQYVLHRYKKRKPEYLYNDWAQSFAARGASILNDCALLKPLFNNNVHDYNRLGAGERHRLLSLAIFLGGSEKCHL